MANQNVLSGIQVNRGLLVGGAVLTGVGAVLGLAGAVMVGVALASAGRSFVQQMDTPPTELAARKFQDAKAASLAGWEVWRSQQQQSANN